MLNFRFQMDSFLSVLRPRFVAVYLLLMQRNETMLKKEQVRLQCIFFPPCPHGAQHKQDNGIVFLMRPSVRFWSCAFSVRYEVKAVAAQHSEACWGSFWALNKSLLRLGGFVTEWIDPDLFSLSGNWLVKIVLFSSTDVLTAHSRKSKGETHFVTVPQFHQVATGKPRQYASMHNTSSLELARLTGIQQSFNVVIINKYTCAFLFCVWIEIILF